MNLKLSLTTCACLLISGCTAVMDSSKIFDPSLERGYASPIVTNQYRITYEGSSAERVQDGWHRMAVEICGGNSYRVIIRVLGDREVDWTGINPKQVTGVVECLGSGLESRDAAISETKRTVSRTD